MLKVFSCFMMKEMNQALDHNEEFVIVDMQYSNEMYFMPWIITRRYFQ